MLSQDLNSAWTIYLKQQAEGMVPVNQNALVISNMHKLLSHPICSTSHPKGYLNRLVFVIGLHVGLIPTALPLITLDQFELKGHDGNPMSMFVERIDSRDCSAKTKHGASIYELSSRENPHSQQRRDVWFAESIQHSFGLD